MSRESSMRRSMRCRDVIAALKLAFRDLDRVRGALKPTTAASAEPRRSPQREQLASAIAARAAAEADVEEARRAVARGRDVVAEVEAKLETAQAEAT
jgi:hypothetical protein